MKNLTGIFFLTILLASFHSYAQGDLLITPKRVVFENNRQKEEISLVNIGKDTATFSISFVQYNMKEDGAFVFTDKPDSGQMFADPYLRVFPRKVTLAPREPQVISLQCRRTADMAAGEYRSHLYFRSEKDYKALGTQTPPADSSKLRISLVPIFGLSIPVIIRSGAVSATAGLTDLKLETSPDKNQTLNLTITRTGNSSLYGDVVVEYFPAQGKPVEMGRMNGVGVYTNIKQRHIKVKLANDLYSKLSPGKLKVQYVTKNENNTVINAENELNTN